MAEYIVSLREGVDGEQFHNEMVASDGNVTVPARAVNVVNKRSPMKRLWHYDLTPQEAARLRIDNRVEAVEIKPSDNPFIEHSYNAVQVANFQKPDTQWWENYVNWGLKRCTITTNPYETSDNIVDPNVDPTTYNYVLDGSDVDIVIMDTGVQYDHPEFLGPDNRSRVKTIDWPTESGITTIVQPQSHYLDYDGHGTHVAGIAAGSVFGWAKNATIYSMHINLGQDTNGFNIEDAFDMILAWHRRKENRNRPTIVNMSWGVTTKIPAAAALIGGEYRGNPWNFSDAIVDRQYIHENFGIVKYSDNNIRLPSTQTSYDVATQELVDAGIHVVIAAGNIPTKIDVEGGQDYDNVLYFTLNNSNSLYSANTNRPGSPYSKDAITVANVDYQADANGIDTPAGNSTRGPAIDVWAPGSNIMSAYTSTPNLVYRPSGSYHKNQRFRQTVLSGTSQAAPQVTGYVAHLLQMHPMFTPAQLKEKIRLESVVGAMQGTVPLDNDWLNNENALWSSPNLFLYDRFAENADAGSFTGVNYVNFAKSSVKSG